jgi:flagellar assembly factor FliW
MPVTIESVRFGTVEVPQEEVIEFPFGLIGLGGSRYTLLDRNPGTGFLWLHAVDDPALALPVVNPYLLFSTFSLELTAEDREQTGLEDLASAQVYVTVRATPDPLDITVNLRAPLVVIKCPPASPPALGYQVINVAPEAPLRAPLFGSPTGPPAADVA